MCRSRSHIHKPCGCTTSHVYICPSFPIQPPPQTLRATHRRYTTDTAPNPFYTPRHLFLCRKSFHAFPDVQDPAPCRSHRVLERDVRLVRGPPRAPDGAWDEFDGFSFRRRVRDTDNCNSPGVKLRKGIESGDRGGWEKTRGGVYNDPAASSEVCYNIHQTAGSNGIHLSMTARRSTKQMPSRAKKESTAKQKQHRQRKQQKRQGPRTRHLSIIPQEGYESFPLMDINMDADADMGADKNMPRERDIEKCGLVSDDEADAYQKKGIFSRVWSLGMIGRRGSSLM